MAGVSQLLVPLTELTLSSASAQHGFAMLPPNLGGQALEYTVYVSFLTGVTAGVVKVESAFSRDYDGTWPAEATVTFTGTAPNLQVVHLTALNEATRIRISTAISDGTVKVYYMAANRV